MTDERTLGIRRAAPLANRLVVLAKVLGRHVMRLAMARGMPAVSLCAAALAI